MSQQVRKKADLNAEILHLLHCLSCVMHLSFVVQLEPFLQHIQCRQTEILLSGRHTLKCKTSTISTRLVWSYSQRSVTILFVRLRERDVYLTRFSLSSSETICSLLWQERHKKSQEDTRSSEICISHSPLWLELGHPPSTNIICLLLKKK